MFTPPSKSYVKKWFESVIFGDAIAMMSKTDVKISKSADRQVWSGFDRDVALLVGPNGAKNSR
jgi:hypothetical protein